MDLLLGTPVSLYARYLPSPNLILRETTISGSVLVLVVEVVDEDSCITDEEEEEETGSFG